MINVYNRETDANKQVSAHFKVREFCKGCTYNVVYIDSHLTELLENIRAHFGKPVVITIHGGYRDTAQNKASGGKANSQHQYGRAADIKVEGVSPKEVQAYCKKTMLTGGLGIYKTFTHIDVRPNYNLTTWRD